MLTYSFSNRGSDSLYAHLYKSIKNDILSGKLPSGTKLPSKRSLAKNLNISTITVENAYAQLLAEGYLYSLPKKGYYISDMADLPKSSPPPAQPLQETKAPEYFADFSSNQIHPENFPFLTWRKLSREVMNSCTNELMKNSPGVGLYPLRQAIARHLLEFRGMHVTPEQIVIGAGTEYLYSLLIQLFGPHHLYAIPTPGYRKIDNIYTAHRVSFKSIPMEKQGISIESLYESRADILHFSPSHHFPTGIVTPISRRYELLSWAAGQENRFIIEDDYDSEFRLMGKPLPTLQSIDVTEKVIYMNTFSKSLSPTIRISYMVLPPHLMALYFRKLGFYACTVSNFEQYTLAKFIERGYLERHINKMRTFYRSQRDTLLNCIKKHPSSSLFSIQEEDAGLHFLFTVNSPAQDRDIIHRGAQKGIRLSSLREFETGESLPRHPTFVINYSSLPPERIEEAVRRLIAASLCQEISP